MSLRTKEHVFPCVSKRKINYKRKHSANLGRFRHLHRNFFATGLSAAGKACEVGKKKLSSMRKTRMDGKNKRFFVDIRCAIGTSLGLFRQIEKKLDLTEKAEACSDCMIRCGELGVKGMKVHLMLSCIYYNAENSDRKIIS